MKARPPLCARLLRLHGAMWLSDRPNLPRHLLHPASLLKGRDGGLEGGE
jgi:hypothetical protein